MAFFVINIDDFGYSKDTFEASVDLIEREIVSSCTVMVSMPYSKIALEYVGQSSNISYGLHLCLSDESPLSSRSEICSLTGPNGNFYKTKELWIRAFLGQVKKSELEIEISAQIEKFIRISGKIPSHIDGHGHIHRIPIVMDVLRSIMLKFGIDHIRRTQNIYISAMKCSVKTLNLVMNRMLCKGFYSTDWMFIPTSSKGEDWVEGLLSVVPIEGIVEIAIHPGFDEFWRRSEYDQIIRLASLTNPRCLVPFTFHGMRKYL